MTLKYCFRDDTDITEPFSVHPKKTLATREFYLMWIAFFALNTVNSFINSYSKPFAQQYIQDDKFLASMATASSVMNGLCRLGWGKVFDLQGYQVINIFYGPSCPTKHMIRPSGTTFVLFISSFSSAFS